MLDAMVVEYQDYYRQEVIVNAAVNEMCSTNFRNTVTKNGAVIYFIDEKNVPDFLSDLVTVVNDKNYYKHSGDFINYTANGVVCDLDAEAYSVLKESDSSFSLTIHEKDGSRFVVGFWSIDDYYKVKLETNKEKLQSL